MHLEVAQQRRLHRPPHAVPSWRLKMGCTIVIGNGLMAAGLYRLFF